MSAMRGHWDNGGRVGLVIGKFDGLAGVVTRKGAVEVSYRAKVAPTVGTPVSLGGEPFKVVAAKMSDHVANMAVITVEPLQAGPEPMVEPATE